MIGLGVVLFGTSGCSSAMYRADSGSSAWNDLYVVHDRTAIAREQQAKAEARKAEAEARQAEWEALLAEVQARNAEEAYYAASEGFGSVLADDYESAYARRLRGFESATYRLPASYFELQYNSPTVYYLSAYDPAFYNVVVMGDQVWVEPKYITSMFGSWGGLTIYNGGWYFGFGIGPSYAWWGYPHYSWWDWGWAYYNPWYGPWYNPWWYGPGWWGPGCPPHYGGWWGPHAPAPRPHNYRLAGGGSASRYRPGMTTSGSHYRTGGAAGRYSSGTVLRGSGTSNGRTYYQSGGRTDSNSRVYDRGNSTSGSNRNTYTPQRNNNTYTPQRNNNNNSYSPGRTSSSGSGSRGGSVGGGSRGGSSSGGSRGFGGR